jgi:hypothetical protein
LEQRGLSCAAGLLARQLVHALLKAELPGDCTFAIKVCCFRFLICPESDN